MMMMRGDSIDLIMRLRKQKEKEEERESPNLHVTARALNTRKARSSPDETDRPNGGDGLVIVRAAPPIILEVRVRVELADEIIKW